MYAHGVRTGPGVDPSSEQIPFALTERLLFRAGRRHLLVGIFAGDAGPNFAVRGVAGYDRNLKRSRFGIEPKFGLTFVRVGPVAGEAAIGQDGADVPIKRRHALIRGERAATACRDNCEPLAELRRRVAIGCASFDGRQDRSAVIDGGRLLPS
jgi:hypothetical protein